MTNKALKLRTYSGQLIALLDRMQDYPQKGNIAEYVDELAEEVDVSPLNPKAILDINQEIKSLIENVEVKDEDRKSQQRALRVCDRVIRTFNYSGTEKILQGKELEEQWKKRNAMGRGELDPPRYDGKGNLFFGIIDGRLYEDGMKVNGIRDGFFYYNGKRYNGWHDDGFYYQGGLRHTGARLTYKEIILFENGKEVGRQPRDDI